MRKNIEEVTIDLFDDHFDSGLSNTTKKTQYRMILASKIYEAIKEKGWTKSEFARRINQQPSVISKWLSGTHNFTMDTLFDIGHILGQNFISFEVAESEYETSTGQAILKTLRLGEVSSHSGFSQINVIDFHRYLMEYKEPLKKERNTQKVVRLDPKHTCVYKSVKTFRYEEEKEDLININELQWDTTANMNSCSLLVN